MAKALNATQVGSLDEIIRLAEEAHADLSAQFDHDIQRMDELEEKDVANQITPGERAELQRLGTSTSKLAAAIMDLSSATQTKINNSSEVQAIKDDLGKISEKLSNALKRVNTIAEAAQTAGKILAAVGKVATLVAAL